VKKKMEELAKVRVFRFDPSVDKEFRYDTYETYYKGLTVLQVLKHIYENVDPTLSFRYGCGGPNEVRCGACAVLVNGIPVLSCQKKAEKEMAIEPHPKFVVIKDLVVDFRHKRIGGISKESKIQITVDSERCTRCSDCVFICSMRVWEIRKVAGKSEPLPVDINSCCGSTCVQCAMFCQSKAIKIVDHG
jgi:NAD-dependent dihydropyrimidine dehydrogenase PreA subunit